MTSQNGDDMSIAQWSNSFADRESAEFLLKACHDLRSPIRAMRAHAELMLKDLSSAKERDWAERLAFIAGGAKRADNVVEGLTQYAIASLLDAGSFRPTPVDVILRTALAKMSSELRDGNAEVTYGPLPRVNGHPDRLIQVFEHLIANAVRHRGSAGSRISIDAELERDTPTGGGALWRFSVRDNGPGIPPNDLEGIFRPFEKIGAERSGAGLGLTICRLVVERHGGRIWAESEAGGGATFLFTLPSAED